MNDLLQLLPAAPLILVLLVIVGIVYGLYKLQTTYGRGATIGLFVGIFVVGCIFIYFYTGSESNTTGGRRRRR